MHTTDSEGLCALGAAVVGLQRVAGAGCRPAPECQKFCNLMCNLPSSLYIHILKKNKNSNLEASRSGTCTSAQRYCKQAQLRVSVQLCLWPLHLCHPPSTLRLNALLPPPSPPWPPSASPPAASSSLTAFPPSSLKKVHQYFGRPLTRPAQLNNGISGTLNGLALLQRAD